MDDSSNGAVTFKTHTILFGPWFPLSFLLQYTMSFTSSSPSPLYTLKQQHTVTLAFHYLTLSSFMLKILTFAFDLIDLSIGKKCIASYFDRRFIV